MRQECPPATTRLALAALLALAAGIVVLKTFAALTSVLVYRRSLDWCDLLAACGMDSFVVSALALALLAGVGLRRIPPEAQETRLIPVTAGILLLAVIGVAVALIGFYAFCGFIFWEWGAFVERHHVEAAVRAGVGGSLLDYARDVRLILPFAVLVLLLGAAWLTFRALKTARACRRVLVGTLAATLLLNSGALVPLARSQALDPSTASPLATFFEPFSSQSDGLGNGFEPPRALISVEPASPADVPPAYQRYRGVASGKDLIIVVLESVRRDSLPIYGYERDTMPHLTRLAASSLVFQNAYVHQPRSCKTFASLLLGVAPDPRLRSLAWQRERMAGHENLLSAFRDAEYRLFFGILMEKSTDGFDAFVQALSGNDIEIVGYRDLGRRAMPGRSIGDDTVLVDRFLSWYAAQEGNCLGILWFAGAHHPYVACRKRFPEETERDQYDNCLFSSDTAIDKLTREVERLRGPGGAVFLILGDHGEAFREHVGDSLHGNYLYDVSVRIPCLFFNRELFPKRSDLTQRFQPKDLPATIFYLFGMERPFRQSVNIFAKTPADRIYLSNVYQDFKLGMVEGQRKFVYRPKYEGSYVFAFEEDPGETRNLIADLSAREADQRRAELVAWYYAQIAYLNAEFPPREE